MTSCILNGLVEMKRIWICLILIVLLNVNSVHSSSASSSEWDVHDSKNEICIRMEATIGLTLSYLAGNEDSYQTAQVNVPSGLIVNQDLSSCNKTIDFNGTLQVDSQIIHLDFPHDPAWTGWWIEFLFTTKSERFHASSSEFTLYGVKVFANYSTQESIFVGHKDSYYIYNQTFGDTESPSDIAADIFANTHYSYFCSSATEYPINTNESYGLKASIILKKIRVQAYAPSGNTKYGDREICPQDQTSGDLIPVIVGGVLSGLVIITLIIYLLYRARQPPSVLYLTNANSHFEDIGIKKNHHGSIEDDDEEEESNIGGGGGSGSTSHQQQRPIARHLQQHSNLGFEE